MDNSGLHRMTVNCQLPTELAVGSWQSIVAFWRSISLCAIASLWLFSFTARSQVDSSKILSTVPVFSGSDSIARISVMQSSVPHFILSEEKLAALAVTDIGSAMKFIPGVQLKDYGGIGGIKTVSFRSLGATHTGVTVDGIRVPNVQSGSVNLTSFEIFGVNELAFTSGQTEETNVSASAYLNANSISIKSQLATRPTKLKLNLYSSATTISTFEEGTLVQLPLTKNIFLGVQGMTRFGEGDYAFIYAPGGITVPQNRNNSALFSYKLKSVVGLNTKKSLTLFSGQYYNNQQELPGAMILYNSSNDQKLWNEDFRFSVLHDQRVKAWKLQLNLFYQSAWLRYYDPAFLNLQGFIDDFYLQKNYGGGFMAKRAVLQNRILFFAGTDIGYSDLEGSSLVLTPSRMENNSVVGLSVVFGKFKIESNMTAQLVSDKAFSGDSANIQNFQEISPFVSLAWMPFKKKSAKFRTFYKRAFTMPTFNDLYYNFIGNTNLKPERANLFNAGVTYAKESGKWLGEFSADAYYNQIENKIVAIPTKDLFNWSMQNIGEIQVTGYDVGFLLSFQHKAWRFLLNGSFSYNLSLDKTDPESNTYNQQIPYTPFKSGTAGLSVSMEDLVLNMNTVFSGFRYSLNENIYSNYLEPFTDISINLSKGFLLKKKFHFNLNLAVMNLLNKNYEVIRSFPMPGRYYQAILRFNIR